MSGRIQCGGCGANNFDTVTVCWKCSRPLNGQSSTPPSPRAGTGSGAYTPSPLPPYSAPNYERAMPATAPAPAQLPYNEKLAHNSAVAMGLLFPYVALPVAIAFMMCPNARKQAIGKVCLMWGVLSTILHTLLMFAVMLGMRPYLNMALNAGQGAIQRQNNQMRGLGLE